MAIPRCLTPLDGGRDKRASGAWSSAAKRALRVSSLINLSQAAAIAAGPGPPACHPGVPPPGGRVCELRFRQLLWPEHGRLEVLEGAGVMAAAASIWVHPPPVSEQPRAVPGAERIPAARLVASWKAAVTSPVRSKQPTTLASAVAVIAWWGGTFRFRSCLLSLQAPTFLFA